MINKKISLVIPFFNESKKIVRLMKIILNQISKPDEIIFINDSSNDNSELKLRLFINNVNFKLKNKVKIVKNKKRFPSTAKNLGIKIAKYDYVVFFDVGLSINRYFIYNIKNKIRPDNNFYIQGKFFFKSEDNIDKCYLMQTYGLNKFGDCIPSSCFHKSIFSKIGYFENFRSGYDKVWLKKLKKEKKLKFYENKMSTVNYMTNISGKNFFYIFKKIFYYSSSVVGLKKYNLDKIYFFFILLSLVALLTNNIIVFFSIYLILRTVVIPLKKNKELFKKNLKPLDFLLLPFMGLTIDIARSLGFVSGYLKKII